MYYEALDEAVTLHIKRNGLTQDALAAQMGMAPNTFSWKRRGIHEFSLGEAAKLADIVGISLDDATGRGRKAG